MVDFKNWRVWLVALIILVLAAGVAYFWFSGGGRYVPPEPVKMTAEEVKRPEILGAKLNLPPAVAREVVREIQTVEKPIYIFKDVPPADVPKKIDEAVKNDKPDKVVVTEDKKDVNVYSIHLEKKTRLGWYARAEVFPSPKPEEVGLMLKKGDDLFMAGYDIPDKAVKVTYGKFF